MIAKVLSRLGIEVWKDLPEYIGHYQVSNLGNIRSLKYNKTKILSKRLNKNERHSVNLSKDGIIKSGTKLHQLVAICFLNHKPCGHKLVVDHINNNKTNDKLYNLQVITARENSTKDKKGTSKYTGVCWHKRINKWQAAIQINGIIKHLGYYKNEQKASQAYQNELNKIKNNE